MDVLQLRSRLKGDCCENFAGVADEDLKLAITGCNKPNVKNVCNIFMTVYLAEWRPVSQQRELIMLCYAIA